MAPSLISSKLFITDLIVNYASDMQRERYTEVATRDAYFSIGASLGEPGRTADQSAENCHAYLMTV